MGGRASWMAHGGRLDAARRAFPSAPEPWLDLSTGISPFPYPVPQIEAEDWVRLPDLSLQARVEGLARRAFGAPASAAIVAAGGSELLLRLLPLLRAPSRVAIVGPTYSSHAEAWSKRHDVSFPSDLVGAEGADVRVLVNPNNPDGRIVSARRLAELAEAMSARGGWLVVDEAFADLDPTSLPAAIEQWPEGLVVLRSFGKAFGLAGVRLGFAIMHPSLAEALRQLLGDWPVSGPALRVAAQAYSDDAWLEQAAVRLAAAAARLDELVLTAGGRVVGGTHLFRLTAWSDGRAMFERLAQAGILTRPFAERPDHLRFGVPAPTAWARLGQALGVEQ